MKASKTRRKFYRFRNRMLAIMLLTMILCVGVLVGLHNYNTGIIDQHVVETTNELLNIIQIAETKIPTGETPQMAVQKYMEELTSHGVSGVRIVDASGQNSIIASTNPKEIGRKIKPKRAIYRKKLPFKIYGTVSDEEDAALQEPYKITFPVVQGEEVIGYSVLDMPLDNFKKLLDRIYLERVLATFGILLVATGLSIYLAIRFTRPIDDLVEASRQVAAGNLDFSIPIKTRDEIGTLAATFNEMIEKLRESRKLEERLYQVEKQSTLGRLASGIAHEIRNPLNYINLSIDYAKDKFQPEDSEKAEAYQKTLDNIKGEILRLKKMVSEFLEFGKPTRLALSAYSLRSIVDDVVNLLARKIEDQHIKVKLDLPAGENLVRVDHEQIKTCLINILINPIESMPHGGALTISALEDLEQPKIRLVVADSGGGIADEVQGKVFEPYYSTKETGVGLGLAITKKIIEDHGGRVWLESKAHQGTRIFVELPLVKEPEMSVA